MRVNRKLAIAVCGLAAVATIGAANWFLKFPTTGQTAPQLTLEKMGHLISLKVKYAEIIELQQKTNTAVFGQKLFEYGRAKVLFVAKGDCIIGTDLTTAKTQRNRLSASAGASRTVELTLPRPRPLEFRVNHDPKEQGGSYLVNVDESLLVGRESRNRAIDHAMTAAQNDIKRACSQPDLIESARQNAQTVLTALFVANGEQPIFHWL